MAENDDFSAGQLSLENSPVKWLFNVSSLVEKGRAGEICATKQELQLLSQKLGKELNMHEAALELHLSALTCSYFIKPCEIAMASNALGHMLFGKNIEAYCGSFQLNVKYQTNCVVSLEPIEEQILDEFEQVFIKAGTYNLRTVREDEQSDELLESDPPVIIDKGRIGLGPFLYQHLSLAIDPNPRKVGASFGNKAEESGRKGDGEAKPPSPFAVLKDYKGKK